MDLIKHRKRLERKKGQRQQTLQSIGDIKGKIRVSKKHSEDIIEAQCIIKEVAHRTQQKLEYRISEIVSLALATVFGEDAYEFKIEFIPKKGKTEAHLFFIKDGVKIKPIDACGGGPINIASFALRIASWHIKNPKARNVLIEDEPFKDLSVNYLPKACEMMQMLSKELNLQIIFITHIKELAKSADKVFRVVLENGISQVIEMTKEEYSKYLFDESQENELGVL